MKLLDAVLASNCDTATRQGGGTYHRTVYAKRVSMEAPANLHCFRVIISPTDPTVIRKISQGDLMRDDWAPVQVSIPGVSRFNFDEKLRKARA